MNKLLNLRIGWSLVLYILADIFCVGMGMGVPFFCILLGLPLGWMITQRIMLTETDLRATLRKSLVYAAATSAITLGLMAVLWGPAARMLFDPAADLANFGMPLLLFEPTASFIGWLVLMIFISPFLQFLMTLFGVYLTGCGFPIIQLKKRE
ncbi:MAG TPA: hypothetical protein PKH77_08300 [Anaerolineae bacterium]|nr:hypothetical protein [Anaerolineae bacterium]